MPEVYPRIKNSENASIFVKLAAAAHPKTNQTVIIPKTRNTEKGGDRLSIACGRCNGRMK